jgi:hypothetical protein
LLIRHTYIEIYPNKHNQMFSADPNNERKTKTILVGAGTNTVAAINLNRKFLGIGIDEKALDSVRMNIQKSSEKI